MQKISLETEFKFKQLTPFLTPYWGHFSAALLCMLVLAVTTGIYAYLVGPMIKFLFSGKNLVTAFPIIGSAIKLPFLDSLQNLDLIVLLPLFILVISIIKGLSYFGQFFIMGLIGQKVVVDLRRFFFAKLLLKPLAFFSRHPGGELVSRFTNDITQVEQAVTYAAATLFRDVLQIAVLLGVAFYLDFYLSLISFFLLPLAAVPLVKHASRLKRVSSSGQEQLAQIANRVREVFAGIKLVQLFGTYLYEEKRFDRLNKQYLSIMLRSFFLRAAISPLMEIIGALGLAGTIWYAGARIRNGELSPENFISFFATVMMLYQPIKTLGRLNNFIQPGMAAAGRLFSLLKETKNLPEPQEPQPVEFRQQIELRDATFAYQEKPVLQNLNLTIKKGESLALVGKSGAGKSTVADLLPRFYDLTCGSILIDGTDIRQTSLKKLRSLFSVVTQNPILFEDTVYNNINYGSWCENSSQVETAAKLAGAHDFIQALPQGYQTRLDENGSNLSGGERQRLCIARIILKKTAVMIFDEATANLDLENERLLQKSMDILAKEGTLLIIAHRQSTVRWANRIVVLADGKIVQQGTHQELLSQHGEYRRLYSEQLV